jgi:putative ABC transport system permease protein
MIADVRGAFSQARRHPWFFGGAALSLAIGMSVATAVFSVVEAGLLRPLPFHDSDRLVHIAETVPYVGGMQDRSMVPSKFAVAAREASGLADVGAWERYDIRMGPTDSRDGEGRAIRAARVTTNFFRLLGARPLLGRDFELADGRPGALAVLISHQLWTTRFGADSTLVGREIILRDSPHRVIGVMPEGFGFPPVDAWFPLSPREIETRAANERENDFPPYLLFGRLRPGATIDDVSAELAVIYKRTYGSHPLRGIRSSRAVPLSAYLSGMLREPLLLWSAIAILVGILCAVNFATVSLARGMRRRSEIAVRAALGASAWRVIRLLIAESVLIAMAGGILAIMFGAWLLRFVEMWFSSGLIVLDPSVNWTTIVFAVGATTLVGVAFAAAPAIELAKVDLRSRLQGESGQSTSRRADLRGRRLLVGMQLSLALTTVASVAAIIDGERKHWSMDVGFDHRSILLVRLRADSLRPETILERVRSAPNVASAGIASPGFGVTAWTDDTTKDAFASFQSNVSPDYFGTLGIRPSIGRMPTDSEIAGHAPVVLLSRATAVERFGSDTNAVGRRLHLKAVRKPATWVTVIGVVPDVGGRALFDLYAPIYTIHDRPITSGMLVVRARGELQQQNRELMAATGTLGRSLSLTTIVAAQSLLDVERGERVGRMLFVLSIGALALVLAVIGMYGLTSYNTEARAREFGIRIALGASRRTLANSLVGEMWPMAGLGIAVAIYAAGRLTTFLDDQLRNPLAEHPVVVFQLIPALAVAITLSLVLVTGTAMPLRRVLRMNVMAAIRGEGAR